MVSIWDVDCKKKKKKTHLTEMPFIVVANGMPKNFSHSFLTNFFLVDYSVLTFVPLGVIIFTEFAVFIKQTV